MVTAVQQYWRKYGIKSWPNCDMNVASHVMSTTAVCVLQVHHCQHGPWTSLTMLQEDSQVRPGDCWLSRAGSHRWVMCTGLHHAGVIRHALLAPDRGWHKLQNRAAELLTASILQCLLSLVLLLTAGRTSVGSMSLRAHVCEMLRAD